jgi:hypothetical protein
LGMKQGGEGFPEDLVIVGDNNADFRFHREDSNRVFK